MENTSLPEWDCLLPLEMLYRGAILKITLSGVNRLFDIAIPAIFSFYPLPTLFPARGGIGWGDVLCSMPFAFSLEEREAEPWDIGDDGQYK